jgi:hypothetical protein
MNSVYIGAQVLIAVYAFNRKLAVKFDSRAANRARYSFLQKLATHEA